MASTGRCFNRSVLKGQTAVAVAGCSPVVTVRALWQHCQVRRLAERGEGFQGATAKSGTGRTG